MNMNSLFTFVDICTIGVGLYCLYTCFFMKKNNAIHDNKLLMSDKNPMDRCKDPKGYIEYTFPRLLAFSLACIVLGIVCFISDKNDLLPLWATEVVTFALIGLLIWFWRILKKTIELFW